MRSSIYLILKKIDRNRDLRSLTFPFHSIGPSLTERGGEDRTQPKHYPTHRIPLSGQRIPHPRTSHPQLLILNRERMLMSIASAARVAIASATPILGSRRVPTNKTATSNNNRGGCDADSFRPRIPKPKSQLHFQPRA